MARQPSRSEAALGAIEAELFDEKIQSLGRAGGKAEAALAALAAFEGEADSDTHHRLLDAAAAAVWAYGVQRELCGLPGSAVILRDLAVPPAVAARLGISKPR